MPHKSVVKEQYANKEYPIHIVGRNVEISDPIRSYAIEKLKNIKRFGGNVMDVTITMEVQKILHTVDFLILVNNTKIRVSGHSTTMYAAIDMAIAHLEAKLRRYVEKLHEHHAKHISEVDLKVNVVRGPTPLLTEINDQIEEENLRQIEEELQPHKVVAQEHQSLKTLTTDEAIMKMELSNDEFMVYRDEADLQLRVIYRREDGNYGVMELS